MLLKKASIVFLLILHSVALFSLEIAMDSVHVLKEVEVATNRLQNFAAGNKLDEIDTATLQLHAFNTLADLLSNQSQIQIKSYGIAGLATPSFRGSGANHTAILWNGFSITSSTSGLLDFTLVPVSFINNIKLQFGGAGALWGTGAIGGTIHLNSFQEFDKGVLISSANSYGSFDDKQQNIEWIVSKKRFISVTKLFNHDAANNFPFANIAQFGKPIQLLSNAEIKQYGILQENYFKLSENQKLSLRLWYQNNDRNIPPTMTTGNSKANQKDEFYRSTIDWQLINKKISFFARAAYFDETLKYNDPMISLVSDSRSKIVIAETECKIPLQNFQLINFGVNNTYSEAFTSKTVQNVISSNYIKNPTQNRTSLFGSYKIRDNKSRWIGTASVRKEFISNGKNPFTASAGGEAWLMKAIRFKGIVSNNYRVPTFNELYWTPGGNPNLLPEKGISKEFGVAWIRCVTNFSCEAQTTIFSNKVTNWIIWVPNAIEIWSPKNVLSVWSRGVEYDLKVNYTLNKIKLSLNGSFNYVHSTIEKTNVPGDATLHKQLFYTPIKKGVINTNIGYNNLMLSLTYNYVGYRYTTSDNSEYLNPYKVVNVNLSKTFVLTNLKLNGFVQVNNLFNEAYQTIAYYPMPGRYYQVGINIHYNQPNKSTQLN